MTTRWDRHFMAHARLIATMSKDPSTKVGAVVVGPYREVRSMGFNGLPRGVADTSDRLNDRDLKYQLIVHAEENAILNASLTGTSLDCCTLYCTMPPCVRCATSIIQAGIVHVFYVDGEPPERWLSNLKLAREIMIEAGIMIGKI